MDSSRSQQLKGFFPCTSPTKFVLTRSMWKPAFISHMLKHLPFDVDQCFPAEGIADFIATAQHHVDPSHSDEGRGWTRRGAASVRHDRGRLPLRRGRVHPHSRAWRPPRTRCAPLLRRRCRGLERASRFSWRSPAQPRLPRLPGK